MRSTSNLLTETQEFIEKSGYSTDDIVYIGSKNRSGHSCTWDEFKVLADKEYDSGYGGTEVATDLIILFSDGNYMFRDEYDGSEWWDVTVGIKVPDDKCNIKTLFCYGYLSDADWRE